MKFILIIITGILTSLFFFSFEFSFLPGYNTKKILAVIGVFIMMYKLAQNRNGILDKNIFFLSIYAITVSIIAYISVTYNNTHDYAYATYCISMWVWLSAAYVITTSIRFVHNKLTVTLICNYLIAVCVCQCFIAIAIDFIPSLKSLVNTYIGSMSGMADATNFDSRSRLYGIGAAVDVAGTRFSAIEIMIVYLCLNLKNISHINMLYYILSFWIISIVGNMISRTTSVGMIMSLIYSSYIIASSFRKEHNTNLYLKYMINSALIILPLITTLFFMSTTIQNNIRFGFEGFFSLFETGKWEVHSNEILQSMYRFPSSLQTWLIGDGYFENPTSDPYYNGYQWKGFYMGTDVGYLRFIYYFGIIGLFSFALLIIKSSIYCTKNSKYNKPLFQMLLFLNFIIWFKVSTDIFLVFALFLCMNSDDNSEEQIISQEQEKTTAITENPL